MVDYPFWDAIPERLEELKLRFDSDPAFHRAMYINQTPNFLYNMWKKMQWEDNIRIYILGPPTSTKSTVAQTINLVIRKMQEKLFKKAAPIVFGRNRADANLQFALATQRGERINLIMDEDEDLVGAGRILNLWGFANNLRTIRILGDNITICSPAALEEIDQSRTLRYFMILETIDHYRDPVKGVNRVMWHTRIGPLGLLYWPMPRVKKLTDMYEALKLVKQTELTAKMGVRAIGGHIEEYAKEILSRAIMDNPGINLQKDDFLVAARESQIAATQDDLKLAAWRALRLYQQPGKGANAASSPHRGPGEDYSELPEEDYEALRKIALQEYTEAIGPTRAHDAPLIVREFDYPSIANTDSRWSARNVRDALQLEKLSDSAGKLYLRHCLKITNKVREQIGIRFIQHLITKTPNFPTQILLGSGAGERDLTFFLDGKMVASANIKHFCERGGDKHYEFDISPEFRDPVHYAIVVRTMPFTLKVYRGTQGQQYMKEKDVKGTPRDLTWSAFTEDLKANTPKQQQEATTTN